MVTIPTNATGTSGTPQSQLFAGFASRAGFELFRKSGVWPLFKAGENPIFETGETQVLYGLVEMLVEASYDGRIERATELP
jgi:hypothetical protein